MKKFSIIIFIFASLIISNPQAKAFQSNAIVNLEAPYATFYKGTFDNLVMDFSLIVTSPDTLKAMGLKNLGTANYLSHIKYMKLWADAGQAGFQGMGVDREIGNLSYSTTYTSWYIENLSEKITDSQRFFISVETFSAYTTSSTIQMQIPILTDNNSNESFDVGDLGVFMDSGNNGPEDANVTNSNSQVFSTSTVDRFGPKLVITNLFDGDVINDNHFLIQGMARDQGDSYIPDFSVVIDSQPYIVQELDTSFHTWRYDWQNITDGQHTISLQAHDAGGNYTQTGAITARVSQQTLSITNSLVTIDRIVIKNDGLDKATVTVLIKDQNNQPIANRQIQVDASTGLIISIANNNSDQNGRIIFEVRSTAIGIKTVAVKSDSQVIKSLSLNVFSSDLSAIGINFGDLIKASTPAVYYYGADGKRYVFPNQNVYLSWYTNFSAVKTITDVQLALIAIGGNVTYKPGVKMVKIQTDPKVYAVDSHGTLRWIKTEELAKSLYGDNWSKEVEDVSDTLFTGYKMGTPIQLSTDFKPLDVAQTAASINADKGLM